MSIVNDIRRMRESGHVRRCHVVPHHGEYTVASHSWHAATLLILLNPNYSRELLEYILLHDIAERWVGDMPAPAKWYNKRLGMEYEIAESKAVEHLGLWSKLSRLCPRDLQWASALDRLELWLWCKDQQFLGNQHVKRFAEHLNAWFTKNYENVPTEIRLFMERYHWDREQELISDEREEQDQRPERQPFPRPPLAHSAGGRRGTDKSPEELR